MRSLLPTALLGVCVVLVPTACAGPPSEIANQLEAGELGVWQQEPDDPAHWTTSTIGEEVLLRWECDESRMLIAPSQGGGFEFRESTPLYALDPGYERNAGVGEPIEFEHRYWEDDTRWHEVHEPFVDRVDALSAEDVGSIVGISVSPDTALFFLNVEGFRELRRHCGES